MDYEAACDFELYCPGTEPGWRTRSRKDRVFETPYLSIGEISSLPPSRAEDDPPIAWTVVSRPTAVVMAPMTPEGKLLLIRQERIPVQRTLWEFPAGQVEEIGEELTRRAIVDTALRELEEEAGYLPDPEIGEVVPLGFTFTSQGFTNEHLYQFLLRNVVSSETGTDHGDGECIVDCRAFDFAEIRQMIAENKISDGMTLGLCARLWSLGLMD